MRNFPIRLRAFAIALFIACGLSWTANVRAQPTLNTLIHTNGRTLRVFLETDRSNNVLASVFQDRVQLVVNGQTYSFPNLPVGDLYSLEIHDGDFDSRIEFNGGTYTNFALNAFGRGGDDTIVNSTGIYSFLSGGAGNDDLRGSFGQESFSGGTGHDNIRCGSGHDYAEGGPGMDMLFGEAGNDQLIGGDDVDVVDGGPGDDKLMGDFAADGSIDTLRGGPGADSFFGRFYVWRRGFGQFYGKRYIEIENMVDVQAGTDSIIDTHFRSLTLILGLQ